MIKKSSARLFIPDINRDDDIVELSSNLNNKELNDTNNVNGFLSFVGKSFSKLSNLSEDKKTEIKKNKDLNEKLYENFQKNTHFEIIEELNQIQLLLEKIMSSEDIDEKNEIYNNMTFSINKIKQPLVIEEDINKRTLKLVDSMFNGDDNFFTEIMIDTTKKILS